MKTWECKENGNAGQSLKISEQQEKNRHQNKNLSNANVGLIMGCYKFSTKNKNSLNNL